MDLSKETIHFYRFEILQCGCYPYLEAIFELVAFPNSDQSRSHNMKEFDFPIGTFSIDVP